MVKRKEPAWEEVLELDMKMEVYREEKRKVKMCIYQSKREVQVQYGRKMNQVVNGKEVSNINEGKVENCNRIKDKSGRLALEEVEVRRICKKYFGDLYNIDTQEQVVVHVCGFDTVQRGNYFGGEPIRRTEVEVRVGKLKNGKAAGKDEVTGEMIKGGGKRVVD